MSNKRIYQTIAKKTGGNIYVGVVGPVRTGKSTFIHKFLESTVIPGIKNEEDKQRTVDEMPQSGSGKTVTTTEPKFIPSEAVKVTLGGVNLSLRLIDCVGFTVDGAAGIFEDGAERHVLTPWREHPIPFTEAAELGTLKVAREHSTIAMLVTTDGTICYIPRACYEEAVRRAVNELKAAGKPFAIILNSAKPGSATAHELASELESKYGAPVALVNCMKLNSEDVAQILSLVIGEFPIKELRFELPDWWTLLPKSNERKKEMSENIKSFASSAEKISDVERAACASPWFIASSINAHDGSATLSVKESEEGYFGAIKDLCGIDVSSRRELLQKLVALSADSREYEKVRDALNDVKEKGYGIVMPSEDALTISEPRLYKQGEGYGIRLSAVAEAIHMIKTDIRAEVCPVVGTEAQAAEVVSSMCLEYDEDPKSLLESKVFGRSLSDMVRDGMSAKLSHLPDDSRQKLGQTIEKIVNEGADGLICLLL
jgi:stage IV sporulation protein A